MNWLGVLASVGILAGIAAVWVFRRTTNASSIHALVNRIEAHLLEFWIFVDEPAAIWRSWRGLLGANARLLRLLLPPMAILAILTLPLFFWLDGIYATSPLPVGAPAIVTLQFDRPLDQISSLPEMQAPEGILIDNPPVRVFSRHQVSWRIRPMRKLSGELRWMMGGRTMEQRVVAGEGVTYHSRWWPHSPHADSIDRIEISYPSATVAFLGVDAHWSIWFFAFSLIGALAAHYLRKAAATRRRN